VDSQAADIVKWAEKQTAPGYQDNQPKLTPNDVVTAYKMRADGHTQTAIAQHLGVSQVAIHKWLAKLDDSSEVARLYLRGSALRMAKNVVKSGQARDHIQALKGIGVLDQAERDIKIAIGVSLPGLTFASQVSADSTVIHTPSGDVGSDNPRYVATNDRAPSGDAG
jgi:hypothetical protein